MGNSRSLIPDPGRARCVLVHMCVPLVERTPGTLPGSSSTYSLHSLYTLFLIIPSEEFLLTLDDLPITAGLEHFGQFFFFTTAGAGV